MKKIIIGIVIILASVLSLRYTDTVSILRALETIEIIEDVNISDTTITLDGSEPTPVYRVMSGGKLTISHLTIEGNVSTGTFLKVERGGEAIIDTITLGENVNFKTFISNYGIMDIRTLTIDSTSGNEIKNYSSDFIIHDVKLPSVYLGKDAYIGISSDTRIDGVIGINVASTFNVFDVVVRGKTSNVMPAYFMSHFNFVGDRRYEGYTSVVPDDSVKCVLDYVGNVENVKSSQSDVLLDVSSVGSRISNPLQFGDIILTTPSYTSTTAVSGNTLFGTGRHCENGNSVTSSIYGNIFVADNYHILSGDKEQYRIESNSTNTTDISIVRTIKGIPFDTQNVSVGMGAKHMLFVDKLSDDYSIDVENMEYSYLISDDLQEDKVRIDTDTYFGLLLSPEGDISSATIRVNFELESSSAEKHVVPVLETPSLTYSGEDVLNRVKIYYTDGENRVYLSVHSESSMIDVGTYDVSVSTEDSVILDIECFSVEVKPLEIDVSGVIFANTTIEYDGLSHSLLASMVPSNVCTTYTDNTLTSVEEIVATCELSPISNNYTLIGLDSFVLSAVFRISKAHYDLSHFSYKDLTIAYDGEPHRIMYSGSLPSGLSVEYLSEEKINADSYVETIHFVSTNDNYFTPSDMSANLTITPREISLSIASILRYDGTPKTLVVNPIGVIDGDDIGLEMSGDTHTLAGNYEALATTNNPNYTLADDSISYSIEKGIIDIYSFSFEDETIAYTGIEYIPTCELPSYLKMEYIKRERIVDVGSYDVSIQLILIDNENFEALVENVLTKHLTISPIVVDVSSVRFDNLITNYTGLEIEIKAQNIPQLVSAEYINNKSIDVCNKTATCKLIADNANISLQGVTILNATLKILKIDYDMSTVSFSDKTIVYDGEIHSIIVGGTLPIGLSVDSYIIAGGKNVGVYPQTVKFKSNNINYNDPDNMSATLTITKKSLTPSLKSSEFIYNGNPHNIEYNLSGLVLGDDAMVSMTNANNIHAGNYTIDISISNTNYTLTKTQLKYTIKKATIDMSGVYIDPSEIQYDGLTHTPKLCGEVPSIVSYEWRHSAICDVNTYSVSCVFSTSSDYVTPVTLVENVVIKPCPVVVNFSNYTNLIFDGKTKSIGVEIIGFIVEEDYDIVYSALPNKVGEYTCTVKLMENSNYIITGSYVCSFVIYKPYVTYSNNNYVVTATGGKFTNDSEISVQDVGIRNEIASRILTNEDTRLKNSFIVNLGGQENDCEVSISAKSLEGIDSDRLTLYRLSNGNLTKIKFTCQDDLISFRASTGDQIIIVERARDNSLTILLFVAIGLALIFVGTALFVGIKKKMQKSVF